MVEARRARGPIRGCRGVCEREISCFFCSFLLAQIDLQIDLDADARVKGDGRREVSIWNAVLVPLMKD